MSLRNRDLISILDLSRNEIEELFRKADQMNKFLQEKKTLNTLSGKIISLVFLEPSTRTMYSFQSATYRLGGKTLVFASKTTTSLAKGENIADTIRMMNAYSDLIVIRSPYDGTALYASMISSVPVINAGDGKHEHPTQALIDLYTIYKLKGRIDGLTIGVLGDLKYARTIASLLYGLSLFSPRKVYLISPGNLTLRESVRAKIDNLGLKYEEVRDIRQVIGELDILYVTRIQRERYPDPEEYERVKNAFKITKKLLENAKPGLKILHPLPKLDEIEKSIDNTDYAAYFYQASLGIPLRMALLASILG